MKSILDQSFQYIPAIRTDVAQTFQRIKAEAQSAQCEPWFDASAFNDRNNVRTLKTRTA